MGWGNGWPETVIRENQSKEILWNNLLNQKELEAIQNIKGALDKKMTAIGKVDKANEIYPIIKGHFSFYDKNDDTKTETKQTETQNRIEIKNKIDLFYNNLLTDLRTKYESMSYGTDGEVAVDNIVKLASFFVDLYSWDDTNNYVRWDKNSQQTEEKFKWIMRKLNPKKTSETDIMISKDPTPPEWYRLTWTKTEIIEGPLQSLNNRYDLSPAMIGDQETIEKSFAGVKEILSKENIKIKSFNIIWLSSKTDYVYGKQEAKIGNETVVVNDNITLADARAKIAANRFRTNFWNKLDRWYTSKITYQSETWPEYVKWTDKAEDSKYRESQWIRFEVNYTTTKPDFTYTFEKEKSIDPPKWYNQRQKTEILINKKNEYSQLEVDGQLLDHTNGVKWSVSNNEIWWNKFNAMFGKDSEGTNVVSRRYKQYKKFSDTKVDPSKYPTITDPQKESNRVDAMDWTNKMEYKTWEQVKMTPILNLDLNNDIHIWIFKDMQDKWVLVEKDGTYTMPPTKTDKYISEYMSKWTKIYVKDAIQNGQRKYIP